MYINYNYVCMFCGKEKEERWDEYTKYYECNCPDAKKNREIDRKISDLESSRPCKKFQFVQGIEKI